MNVVLLLFLIKAAFATPPFYVVTDTGWNTDWLYEGAWAGRPGFHYKELGEVDSEGNTYFLYKGRPQTWIIGYGDTLATAQATPSNKVAFSSDYINSIAGVYKEKREPELHYKKLGEADSEGDYWFLYTDSRRPQTWIIGFGKTLATAQASLRALARPGRAGKALQGPGI